MTNIKNFIMERKKVLSIIIILTLLFTIIFSGVRYKAATNPLKESKNQLRVLVVNPGVNTNINSERTNVKTSYNGKDKNVDVNVTSVSMPQFIGQVDQLNGKYDVVAITRNDVTGQDTDYTNPFTPYDMFDVNSSDDKSGVPIPEGFKNAYGTGTPDKYRVKNGIQTSEIYGGRTYVEYYSENDITNRRAKEILEMIKSGQLVFFDKDIFDKNDLEDTKLVKNFANASGDNVIKVNRNEITIQNIVDKYFDNNVVKEKDVKPEIKMKSMTEGIKDTSKDSDRNIEAEFVVSTGNAVQDGDKVKIDLYLDFNGDTLFRGTDLVYSTYGTVDKGEVQCKINYEITKEFVGQLDWKIEVSTFKEAGYKPDKNVESNIKTKSYVTGNITYVNSEMKKRIKVLQIVPDSYSVLNLSNDTRMQNYLSGSSNTFLNSYNISVDYKKISEVKDIDDSYTMIIFGFADTYGGSSDLDENVVEKLKKFIQDGKSVMFTHDTMPINIESAGDINKSMTGPKRLAQFFRDHIGQARYVDPMRNNDETNIYYTFTPVYNDEGKVDRFEREYRKIPHDDINIHKELKNKIGDTPVYSYGYTTPILERVRVNNGFIRGNSNEGELYNQPYKVLNTAVDELNEGSITSYPYSLPSNMSVARTHNQWYQLNLEDEDVVPWYTLDPSNVANNTVSLNNGGARAGMFKSYDARNYYYTYSKGNITYSGTGHSDGFTNEELKLFVNTIIKADRSCNHPPTLEAKKKEVQNLLELSDNMEIKRGDDLTLNITPWDIDIGDIINVNVEAFVGTDNNFEKVTLDNCNFNKKSGETFDFTIPKSKYEKKDINRIKVIIRGSDGKADAIPIEKTFVIIEDNLAPIIDAKKVEGDKNIDLKDDMDTKREEDLKLAITPRDPDEDNVIVKISFEKFSTSENKWSKIELGNSKFEKNSGETFNFSLPKENYKDKEISKLRVTIEGEDTKGEKSNTIKNIFNITDFNYALVHGLFDDYSFEHPDNGDAIIKNPKLVADTYGTFAVRYVHRDNSDSITINVDGRIKDINNVVAYKVNRNSLDKVITVEQTVNDNKIKLRINDSKVSKGDIILIKYSGYMPNLNNENASLTNIATINESTASAETKITIVKQPDLY